MTYKVYQGRLFFCRHCWSPARQKNPCQWPSHLS